MAPGSAAGFALAFFVVAWLASGVLGAGLFAARRQVRRFGPRTERVLAAAALAGPPLAAFFVVLGVAGLSATTALTGEPDHCLEHDHHLHICLVHGADWAGHSFALILLALLVATAFARAARVVFSYLRSAGLVARLESHGDALTAVSDDTWLVPSGLPLCVTTGVVRPRILISTAAWSLLDERERLAALSHERAHAAHGDVRWRIALGIMASLGVPWLTARVLSLWERATERLCDAAAASTVGPEVVAEALVRFARATLRRSPELIGVLPFASRDALGERVEALLAGEPAGHPQARTAIAGVLLASVALACGALLCSDSLHHFLESVLTLH